MLSVLFISYNRSELLRGAVATLRLALDRSGIPYEIIVADDCSDPGHANVVDSIDAVTVVRGSRNNGLGANANNGLRACRGRYILQVQDDWEYIGTPTDLQAVVDILDRDGCIGILQMTPVGCDIPASRRDFAHAAYLVFPNDGLPWRRSCDVRPYSDCPHIKRREFVDSVGPYVEGTPMTICETEYKHRVAVQRKWQVAQLVDLPLFRHMGKEHSLNPGGRRHLVVKALHAIPGIGPLFERMLRRGIRWADHMSAMAWSRLARRRVTS